MGAVCAPDQVLLGKSSRPGCRRKSIRNKKVWGWQWGSKFDPQIVEKKSHCQRTVALSLSLYLFLSAVPSLCVCVCVFLSSVFISSMLCLSLSLYLYLFLPRSPPFFVALFLLISLSLSE